MNILDLFAHIGLKADTGPANDFLKSVLGIKGGLVGAIAGTLSLATAVKLVNESFSDTLAMRKFADDTGASVEEMQKWKQVADQVNGSGEGVAASIRAITQNQEKIKLGQGNISGYQLLGIDPRSDPFKVLEALRTKTQGMSQGMRRNIAGQFGISNDLVKTLELTNKEFDKMAGKAYVVSPQSIAAVNQARASVAELGNRLNYMRNEAIAKLAPYIKQGVEWLQKLLTAGTNIVKMIDNFVRGSIGWKNAIIGIVAAFVALNAAVALPVAGILLLFAIFEDLYVYSKGGKSVFGELVKSFPALAEVFNVVFAAVKGVADTLKGLMTGDWSSFDGLMAKWGAFGDLLKGIKDTLVFMTSSIKFDKLKETFGSFFTDIGEGGVGKALTKQGKLFAGELGSIAGFFAPKTAPAGSTTVNNTIEINGATDPYAVGGEVERRLADTYRNTRTPYQNPKAEVR